MPIKLNNGEVISSPRGDKYVLSKILVEVTNALGRPLSFEEARVCPKMPKDTNLYAIHFGSFQKACKEAQKFCDKMESKRTIVQHTSTTAELAKRSVDSQRELIYRSIYGPQFSLRRWKMEKREEIMERVLQLCHEHDDDTSWIKDRNIKHDPILIYAEVIQTFGSVGQLRQEASRLLRQNVSQNTTELPKIDEVLPETTSESISEANCITQEELRTKDAEPIQTLSTGTSPKRKRRGSGKKKSELTLWLEIKAKYLALGRLPTDLEILADEEMSHPVTYYKRLGKGYKERFMDRMMAHEPSSGESQTPESITETITPVQSTAKPEEKNEPESDKEVQSTAKIEEKIVSIDTTEDASTEPDVRRIPIQIIIPKGIKGEIQIHLSF